MKKIVLISLICVGLALIAILFYFNNGWIAYNIQKKQLTTLELLQYYTNIPFTNANIEIESVEFTKDTPKYMDEALKAILLVPTKEIDHLFKEEVRNYNVTSMPMRFMGDDESSVYFNIPMFQAVRRWLIKTSRSITIAVLKPEGEYTKVYVSIDKLGWYLWNKHQLGGE